MKTINVNGELLYPVTIGSNLLDDIAARISSYSNVVIFYAPAMGVVAKRIQQLVSNTTKVANYELPDGEIAKSIQTANACWDFLAESKVSRSDLVVAIGGGSVTDLVGFVAATWLRGVDVVLVPTTVLGMVDAAVGGKCGINSNFGKNLIGSFNDPMAVYCDVEFLSTLDKAEIRSGLAEIIKCGFIEDSEILSIIQQAGSSILDPNSNEFLQVATKAIEVKAAVVSSDRLEKSVSGVGRAALNYGHTLGHAIEKFSNYRWRHGEAVSIGMLFAANLSFSLEMISSQLRDLHYEVIDLVGLPINYGAAALQDLIPIMSLDKKSTTDSLRFVLLEDLAKPVFVTNPPASSLASAFERLGMEG
jgi:3-dehydroquinate synthase